MTMPAYPPMLAELLAVDRLNELGPGQPDRAAGTRLRDLTGEKLVEGRAVRDRAMGEACLAGLWLHFDHLDASHEISQSLHTAEGSYWHGIMHRREPDYDNAKYWFRRVGDHPIFEPLVAEARALAEQHGEAKSAKALAGMTRFDPFRFVDLCREAARGSEPDGLLCRLVQRREWQLLFDYCYQRA